MENSQMTAAQSIDLIARTLRETRLHVERRTYKPFIIWGWSTVIVSLAVWYAVRTTSDPAYFWLWFAIPVAGWPAMLVATRHNTDEGHLRTEIDRMISCTWCVLGATCLAVSIAAMFTHLPILFINILLMGSGTAVTGLALRSTTLACAGFAATAASTLLLVVTGIDQCLVFGAIFLVMMVIPGHILQRKTIKER